MHTYKYVGLKYDENGTLRRLYYEMFDGLIKRGECTIEFNCLLEEDSE